ISSCFLGSNCGGTATVSLSIFVASASATISGGNLWHDVNAEQALHEDSCLHDESPSCTMNHAECQKPCPMISRTRLLLVVTVTPYREAVTFHAGTISPYLSQATQGSAARLRCIAATNQQVRFSAQAQAKVWSKPSPRFRGNYMLKTQTAHRVWPLAPLVLFDCGFGLCCFTQHSSSRFDHANRVPDRCTTAR